MLYKRFGASQSTLYSYVRTKYNLVTFFSAFSFIVGVNDKKVHTSTTLHASVDHGLSVVISEVSCGLLVIVEANHMQC